MEWYSILPLLGNVHNFCSDTYAKSRIWHQIYARLQKDPIYRKTGEMYPIENLLVAVISIYLPKVVLIKYGFVKITVVLVCSSSRIHHPSQEIIQTLSASSVLTTQFMAG